MLTLRLMGGFGLLDEKGAPVAGLSQRRAEAALAFLALCGNLGCSRDRLAALLWPEANEEHARHNLRSALHALRSAVSQDVIISNGETVRLNSALVTTDVSRFAAAIASSQWEDAVEAYGGPLLDGFHVDDAPEFERQIEEERARLFRQCGAALEALARERTGVSGPHGDVTWWTRAVEHDPHNTRLVIQLMRVLAEEGDPANALVHAEQHRRRLWKDLEIEPDTELEAEVRRIRESLRNHTAVRRADGTPVPAPAPPPTLLEPPVAPLGPQSAALSPAPIGSVVSEPDGGRSSGWSRRRVVVTAALVLVSVGTGVMWRAMPASADALDPDRVAIVPFTSTGGASNAGQAKAIRDLIQRDMVDGPAPTAADPARVDRAWSRAGGGDEGMSTLEVDARVAERVGASLVLRGSVDRTLEGTVVTLVVSRFPARRVVARRTAPLGDEALAPTVRRLLLEVLALEADQPVHRLAELVRHPAVAVRLYLAAVRRKGAGGCRSMVSAVWKIDSTLVYPGLACLGIEGYTIGGPSFRDTVARVVWQHRALLTREDAAFTNALVGPWFGLADDAEQRIALWDRAANAAPDWWVPWQVLARELVGFGPRTTIMDWRRRARLANAHALELCNWSQEGPVAMAFWVGIFEGDSVRSQQALDASRRFAEMEPQRPFTNTIYYWVGYKSWPVLFDAAFRDGVQARRLRPTPTGSGWMLRSLTTLALARPSTALYADSFVVRWEQTPQGQGKGLPNYFAASWWQVRGDYARYRERRAHYLAPGARSETPEYNDLAENAHDYVWEVMFRGAPEDSLFRHMIARMRRVASGDSVPAPPLTVRGVAACWVSQWRMLHGDTTGVSAAITLLRALDAKDRTGELDGLPGSGRWVECPLLLEAQRARLLKRGALQAARALDERVRTLPLPRRHWWSFVGNASHDGVRIYNENLAVAQLLADAGDTAAALAAVRRRTRHDAIMADFYQTPTQHLRLEGRLAAAMLDTTGAIAAYENYLALRQRRPAHPPWRAEWDSVRAELARIQKPRP